jgi:chemotaxis protein CheC
VLSAHEVAEMETEALAETGNVVINSCLATMANMLHKPLTMSLPQVIRGDGKLFFEFEETDPGTGVVLFLYINFSVGGWDIRGYIAMLMDLPSLDALKSLINEFIRRVVGSEELSGEA